MASVQTATILEEVLDFLASAPTSQQIIEHQVSETAQTRMRYLLDQNRNGILSIQETEELDEMERTYHFMLILKAKTRLKLMEND